MFTESTHSSIDLPQQEMQNTVGTRLRKSKNSSTAATAAAGAGAEAAVAMALQDELQHSSSAWLDYHDHHHNRTGSF